MTNDWTQEEEDAFNEVEKYSSVKKEIIRRTSKQWKNLTDKDVEELISTYPSFSEFVRTVEKKVKDKNT